jgi:tRNA threonylcarbamoyladenosine biosynthesis protein TsaB
MKVLAIETSTAKLGVAIVSDEGVEVEYNHKATNEHAALLLPVVDELIKRSGIALNTMDGFCVSLGPGSFTGLRIGVTTVKGLAYAANKPVVGVPTLDVIAHNAVYYPGLICPIIDAKKGKVYAGFYMARDGQITKMHDYVLAPVEDVLQKCRNRTLFLGDAVGIHMEKISKTMPEAAEFAPQWLWLPRVGTVAQLGIKKLLAGEADDRDKLLPLYLYSRECSITGV